MMNKKAYTNFSDIVWFFVICTIIALFIIAGVWIFYSAKIDVRLEESKTLGEKIVGVVVENGEVKKEALGNNFDILDEAGIDESVIDNKDYYIYLIIYESDKVKKEVVRGNRDFEIQCGLEGEHFAECYKRELVLDDYKIKILTASNQLGSRV